MSDSPERIQQDIDRSREDAARKIDQIGSQMRDVTDQAREVINQDVPDMIEEGMGAARTEIKDGINVAKAELKEDLTKVSAGSAAIAGGGVLGAVAGFFLLQGIMELLSQRLERWQAAGIVSLGLAGTAVALGVGGKQQLQPDQLKPDRTMNRVKQTAGWAKSQAQSLKSGASKIRNRASTPEATRTGM